MKASIGHWDDVWSKTAVQAPHDTVLRAVRSLGVRSVLEVGAGSGRDLQELGRGELAVTYLDFSDVAARSFHSANPAVPAIVGDARRLPFPDEAFDLTYSLGLIEHFDEPQRLEILREQFRVARRYVLVDVPQKYALAFLVKKGLMMVGRWPYGEETEFSHGQLVSQVRRARPDARAIHGYGRELLPLPRNLKQVVYGRLPAAAKQAFLSSHRLFARGVAGSFGVVFEKAA
jgi:SAM-dependent methyltransferase